MVKRIVLKEHPPTKIFLEIELFDLNKNEEMVTAFIGEAALTGEEAEVGEGNRFEHFKVPADAKNSGQTDPWKQIRGRTPKEKPFQIELERDLLKEEEDEKKKTIKIQAKRKYAAYEYNDGELAIAAKINDFNYMLARDPRAVGDKKLVKELPNKIGKWPKDVKLKYRHLSWPTEECLARIYYYPESEESKYNKKKTESIIATLNKILILQKEGKIEYVIDRFVSV